MEEAFVESCGSTLKEERRRKNCDTSIFSTVRHIQEERRRRIIRELRAASGTRLEIRAEGGCFRLNFQGKEVECSMEENFVVNSDFNVDLFHPVESFHRLIHPRLTLNCSLIKQLLFANLSNFYSDILMNKN